jgi:hypothetical protein
MSQRQFFRVPDTTAIQEWESTPDVHVVTWDRSYPGTSIVSREQSPEFSTIEEARQYARRIEGHPDTIRGTVEISPEKPAQLARRCTRQGISEREALAELGVGSIEPVLAR